MFSSIQRPPRIACVQARDMHSAHRGSVLCSALVDISSVELDLCFPNAASAVDGLYSDTGR